MPALKHLVTVGESLILISLHLSASGTGLDLRSAAHRAALCHAAHHGSNKAASFLLQAGADADCVEHGETALCIAARAGNAVLVRELVACKASLDARDELHGDTALHKAVEGKHAPVVEVLVRAGASVSAFNAKGQTPLDMCGNHHELAAMLSSSCPVQ